VEIETTAPNRNALVLTAITATTCLGGFGLYYAQPCLAGETSEIFNARFTLEGKCEGLQ